MRNSILICLFCQIVRYQLSFAIAAVEYNAEVIDNCTGLHFGEKSFDVNIDIIVIPTPVVVDFIAVTSSSAFYLYAQLSYGPLIRQLIEKNYNDMDAFFEKLVIRYDMPSCFYNTSLYNYYANVKIPLCAKWDREEQCREIFNTLHNKDGDSRNTLMIGGYQINSFITYLFDIELLLKLCKDEDTIVKVILQLDNYTLNCLHIKPHPKQITTAANNVIDINNANMFATTKNYGKNMDCQNGGVALASGGGCDCPMNSSGPFCFFPCSAQAVNNCDTGGAKLPIMNDECFYTKCAPEQYPSNSSVNDIFIKEMNVTMQSAYDKYPMHLEMRIILKSILCHMPDFQAFVTDCDGYRPHLATSTRFLDLDFINNGFCFEPQTWRYDVTKLHAYRNYRLVMKYNYKNSVGDYVFQPLMEVDFPMAQTAAGSLSIDLIARTGLPKQLILRTDVVDCNGPLKRYDITLQSKDGQQKLKEMMIDVDQDCLVVENITISLPDDWATYDTDTMITVSSSTAFGKGPESQIILPGNHKTQSQSGAKVILLISIGTILLIISISAIIIYAVTAKRKKQIRTLKKRLMLQLNAN